MLAQYEDAAGQLQPRLQSRRSQGLGICVTQRQTSASLLLWLRP